MPRPAAPKPPCRVFVPYGKRPPRGVLWAASDALRYHASKPHYSRLLGCEVPAEPARMHEFRQLIRDYVLGRCLVGGWDYYRGRQLACPYRCTLDSKSCPVDVLVEEINANHRRRGSAAAVLVGDSTKTD